ncbi:uncharacterized protein LOC121641165 [Melanotaenia boesemani]|uniref:uncharacterized protein LOC121641165 n=1 Tax=Melanotaenia boesemani TaxID=1250792 RepID=UPI001C03C564|nr:uncharacterized protein LOC121641165 [Melanotaenia boesemani]
MASTGLVLLQLLLLVSLVSASHFFGGSSTFTYKGRNPDGTFRVVIRNRETFDSWGSLYWSCYSGNCGYTSYSSPRTMIDSSTNSPQYNRQWSEFETVETRNLYSDTPFEMGAASCCWVYNRYYGWDWRLKTLVDLGIRSDTHQPNRSPEIAILPVMRVPENCPRTYRLPSFDPDGDRVRCRYGTISYVECASCIQPSGFHLDQDTCTLHYYYNRCKSCSYCI